MLAFLIVGSASIAFLQAQDTSYWYGVLDLGSSKLDVTLQINKKDTLTPILMGSPQQTNKMFPVSKYRFTITDSILFSIRNMGVVYRGKYNSSGDTIFGVFKQGLVMKDLAFAKTKELYRIKRAQDDAPLCADCVERELSFTDKGGYTFNGTLTLPSAQGKYPCAVLLTGSGTQNRDEEILGHKPFKVIAAWLAKNGIASFRYDDRGWGVKVFDSSLLALTTFTFAQDADFILSQIKNQTGVNPNQIGFIGHSEGGLIASISAARNKDVAFVVLMAGTGIKGIDVLRGQIQKINSLSSVVQSEIDFQIAMLNEIYSLTQKGKTDSQINQAMTQWFDKTLAGYTTEQIKNMHLSTPKERQMSYSDFLMPWMRVFMQTDPAKYLSKIKVPLLAMNGQKDAQVIEKDNMPAIQKAMAKAKNKNFETFVPENMNHLFQECKTGSPDEYQSIEQTISPLALQKMSNFILKVTTNK